MTIVEAQGGGMADVVGDALDRLEERLALGALTVDDELIGAVGNLIEHMETSGRDTLDERVRLAQVVAGASGTILPDGGGRAVDAYRATGVIDLRDGADDADDVPGPSVTESRTARRIVVALGAAACVALGFLIYLFGVTAVVMARHQTALDGELYGWLERSGFSINTGDGGVLPPAAREAGDAIAQIIAPDIGMDLIVVEGTDHSHLARGPGRLQSSALPGYAGSTVIMGHRSTHGAPFGAIDDLDIGDLITVVSADGPLPYLVSEISVVSEGDVDGALLDSGDDSTLVLTTADPAFRASGRLVVRADLDGPPLSERAAVLQPIDRGVERSASLGLTGDRNAWFPALLWAHLALAVVIGLLWARRNWYPISSWLVAAPLLGYCLLRLYEQLARLLPATI